jgi:hypothetical protein
LKDCESKTGFDWSIRPFSQFNYYTTNETLKELATSEGLNVQMGYDGFFVDIPL